MIEGAIVRPRNVTFLSMEGFFDFMRNLVPRVTNSGLGRLLPAIRGDFRPAYVTTEPLT